jgi:hypothetical protein
VLVAGIVDVTPVAVPLMIIAVVFVIAVFVSGAVNAGIVLARVAAPFPGANLSGPRSRGAIV